MRRTNQTKGKGTILSKNFIWMGCWRKHASTGSNKKLSIENLPHHAVLEEESTTTKLRVVFDGSAKTSTFISLDDTQFIGAPVRDDLVSILLRFQQHHYVLSADVAKMYRQIEIKKDGRAMQRILWRTNDNSPIKVYELNTVT